MYQHYKQYLSRLHHTSKYRQLPKTTLSDGTVYRDFSSNDYLKLSTHPTVIQAAIWGAKQYGVGATGSRLLSGNAACFETLETRIANNKNTEAALIFNSGFQTNISVLSSLLDAHCLGTHPLVFFDKLNHASLYQAVFLSGATLIRYRHNDMQHLTTLLEKYRTNTAPKFIVTETLFGMDGDLLPIDTIVTLAEEHNAFLYLDEAHATGILGSEGYGLSTTVNLQSIPHLIMGTFSKALGCSGGYVACDAMLKEYLINHTPGFIYSTANSPMVIEAVSAAWEMLPSLHPLREQLWALSDYCRQMLQKRDFNTGHSVSHIIPIILESETLSLSFKTALFEHNILVSCIRPPTVPPNTARIRIALNSAHTKTDIDHLIDRLTELYPVKKTLVSRFNKAVCSYDTVAHVQKISAHHLVQLIDKHNAMPNTILDLGTGTGYMPEFLLNHFPNADYILNDITPSMIHFVKNKFKHHHNIHFHIGDMDTYDFKSTPLFDLIVSNFALQWSDDLEKTLKHFYNHSKTLAFSCLLEGTFQEWHTVFKAVGSSSPVKAYPTENVLIQYLQTFKSATVFFETKVFQLQFNNASDFMQYLKKLGASTSNTPISKQTIKQIIQKNDTPITITYHVFFGILTKKAMNE